METKFAAFVNKNKPAKTTVKAFLVMSIARAKGMSIKKSGGESTLTNGENSFSFQGDLNLYWMYSLTEAHIVFQPKLQYTTARNDYNSIEQTILEKLRIVDVSVKLPEEVVTVAVPSWAQIQSDDNWATYFSSKMFKSEAKKALKAFYEEEIKKLG